jgi:hypothetical protein
MSGLYYYSLFWFLWLWFIKYCVYRHFQKYFSYIVAVGFVGGRNRGRQLLVNVGIYSSIGTKNRDIPLKLK